MSAPCVGAFVLFEHLEQGRHTCGPLYTTIPSHETSAACAGLPLESPQPRGLHWVNTQNGAAGKEACHGTWMYLHKPLLHLHHDYNLHCPSLGACRRPRSSRSRCSPRRPARLVPYPVHIERSGALDHRNTPATGTPQRHRNHPKRPHTQCPIVHRAAPPLGLTMHQVLRSV